MLGLACGNLLGLPNEFLRAPPAEPVTEIDPGFKLGDAATTKQVLVKHLICACTGLPRQDFEWLLQVRGLLIRQQLQYQVCQLMQ
jgi:hypothetical protein